MMKRVLFHVLVIVLATSCSSIDTLLLQQDVDFIKTAISENYPYLQVHLRRDKLDWLAQMAQWERHNLVAYTGSNKIEYLSQFLSGLNGHVHLIDGESFPYYFSAYSDLSKSDPAYVPWAEILNKEGVLVAYQASRAGLVTSKPRQLYKSQTYSFTKEVGTRSLYLKIPTFDGALAESEGPKILEFLRQNSRKDRMIIFDVRGNGGGSDLFWSQYIVRPLISRTLVQASTIMYKGGALSMPFLKAKNVALKPTQKLDPAKSMTFNTSVYRYFSVERLTIEPSGENLVHGPIVVLMDGQNFSSSESFVSFCNSTGFAKTIGLNSGGDGIGFDPILVELPYSHLLLTIPICAALNTGNTLDYENGTTPNFRVPAGIDSREYAESHWSEF